MGSLTFVFSFTCWEGLEERDWPLSSVTYFGGRGGEGLGGREKRKFTLSTAFGVCCVFVGRVLIDWERTHTYTPLVHYILHCALLQILFFFYILVEFEKNTMDWVVLA